MNVLHHSVRSEAFDAYALRRYAPAVAGFVIVRVATGSLIGAAAVAAAMVVVALVIHRGRGGTNRRPSVQHFTPPFGTPAFEDERPYGPFRGKKSAPGQAHTGSKDIEVDHSPFHNSLDPTIDPIGQLVHGLRSQGLATLRAKAAFIGNQASRAVAQVLVRDDSSSTRASGVEMPAVDSVDSLMTSLASGATAGTKRLGWTVVSNTRDADTGRWTAVLRGNEGNTVMLRLVDANTFSAAARGAQRVAAKTPERGFGRELHRNLR